MSSSPQATSSDPSRPARYPRPRPIAPAPVASIFFLGTDTDNLVVFSLVTQGAFDPDRRLVTIGEFGSDFKGKRIQVLWPDTGSWYNAEVRKVNVKAKTASLWYVDSEELEDINLYEAILNMEVSWPKENSPVATSPLKSGKRKPTDDDDDEEEEDESDSDDDLPLASLAPKRAPAKKKPAEKKPAEKKKRAKTAPTPHQRNLADPRTGVRENVFAKFLEAMKMAQGESPPSAPARDDAALATIAADVEARLYAFIDPKEYNAKARTLVFNLKDIRNPGLRAEVLAGVIPADELVRMSPTDLANKDLQEMRREREAKIGEDAFLPDAPEGARVRKTHKGEEVMFDAREILEDEHVTGDGLGHRETPSLAPSDSFHTGVDGDASDASDGDGERGPTMAAGEPDEGTTPRAPSGSPPGTPPGRDGGGDDDDDGEPGGIMPSFEQFAAGAESDDDDDRAAAPSDPGAGADIGDEDEEYDPAKGFDDDADDAAVGDDDTAVGDDAALPREPSPAPEPAPAARDDPPRRTRTEREHGEWSGTVRCQGLRDCVVRAVPVGGERADFAPLFPASLEIKGRVAFDATHRFIRQVVDKSRTRAVTAAVCGPDPAADNSAFNDKAVAALASQYGKRERCGVAEPITGVLEVYFIPRGKLADKLMSSLARKSKAKLRGKGDMLMVAVHKRGIGPDAKPLPAEQPRVPHAADPLPTVPGGRGTPPPNVSSGPRTDDRPGAEDIQDLLNQVNSQFGGAHPPAGMPPPLAPPPPLGGGLNVMSGPFPDGPPPPIPGYSPSGRGGAPFDAGRARAPPMDYPPRPPQYGAPPPHGYNNAGGGYQGGGPGPPYRGGRSPPRRSPPRGGPGGFRSPPRDRGGYGSAGFGGPPPGRGYDRGPSPPRDRGAGYGGPPGGGQWGGGPPRGGYGPPPGPGGPHPHGYGGAPPPPRDYRGYGGNGGGPERRNVPPPPGRYQ